jgi:thiamine-monophosphate kinase
MPSDGEGGAVADLSERELIARIQARLPPAPRWMLVGIGDDAAVVEPERNRVEVLSVDAVVEGVHFDRAFVPPDAIGHRALAVNLSDLAAMGAAPRLALLSMVLPPALPLADFDGIVAGLTALAAHHRLHVAGGNLARSPGPLMIDVTIVGTVKRRQALTRAGARAGDDVYVSGTIGAAAAGLKLLREVVSHQSSVVGHQSPVTSLSPQSPPTTGDPGLTTDELGLTTGGLGLITDDSRPTTDDWRLKTDVLMNAYLRPSPRVPLGVWLGRNRAASACVDLSDGLADGVHRLAEASGVGIRIDAHALPIDPATRRVLGGGDGDALMGAITGGDDYELLFAVRPRMRRHIVGAARHAGVALTRIGGCTPDRAVLLHTAGADMPLPCGYTHFARVTNGPCDE